jgi:dTDP-4-amino-4,6-dideoxygalactose transaminase
VIRIAQPLIGPEEREAVLAVLDSGRLVSGPVTEELERSFAERVAGTREAVAVANGTAALHVALLAHGVGPGDEVITTPFTFHATANMVLAAGARPVFVDVKDDGNIDASLIEAAITRRTRAILPVHLFGRLCDIEAIEDIARRHSLALIEDAAQAHGAGVRGRCAGSFGAGCFSFYATKNMTAGEGGMITTDDLDLAARMRLIRSHGEAERYSSSVLGFNYRMTEVSAAIALAQLGRLDGLNERRRANARYLSRHLMGVFLPPETDTDTEHVWHQYTVRVAHNRDGLAAWLAERDIQTAVYYPTPVPGQPLYRELGFSSDSCPNARRLSAEVLSLPVHPGLSEADLQAIAGAVNEWTAKHGGYGD